jgi:hypothetical protein
MGTNPNDNIFGIMIYTFNDDNVKLLYRKENEEKMSKEEMREAYLFYTKLNALTNYDRADLLTCGSCFAEFLLSDIVIFIDFLITELLEMSCWTGVICRYLHQFTV